MAHIATIKMSKQEAINKYCSVERLCATRNDANGPLQRLLNWLKMEEGGGNFKVTDGKVKRLRFGTPEDDFILLYYFNSKRYKISKTGKAFVSSADPDDMCTASQESLQAVIDTIITEEILRGVGRAAAANGSRLTKMKVLDKQENTKTRVIIGIESLDKAN